MKSYIKIEKKDALNIKGILTDIDDTITLDGKLTASAYNALWKAYDAGLIVVPVTGRPAGWCDMIARTWPVSGVVGENGAFYFYMEKGILKRKFMLSEEARESNRKKLDKIKDFILQRFPQVKVAADQNYRDSDLAIDYKEEVKDLSVNIADGIRHTFIECGLEAKISSIHVNGWYGRFDKLKTSKTFLTQVCGLEDSELKSTILYAGDSPNDVPMFSYFNLSCGIGDMSVYGDRLSSKPAYEVSNPKGEGFSKVVEHVLNLRGVK